MLDFLVRVSKSESVGDSSVGWVGVVRTAAGIRRRTRGGFVNGQGGRAYDALHGTPGRSGIEGRRGYSLARSSVRSEKVGTSRLRDERPLFPFLFFDASSRR
jgi:hypothetical protein